MLSALLFCTAVSVCDYHLDVCMPGKICDRLPKFIVTTEPATREYNAGCRLTFSAGADDCWDWDTEQHLKRACGRKPSRPSRMFSFLL